MSLILGPFLSLSQNETHHQWHYFELTSQAVSHFVWANSQWSKQAINSDNTVLYTHFSSEQLFGCLVLTTEGQLLKIPLFEQKSETNQPSIRRVSQVFQPFLADTGVRWVPCHMKRASAFNIDVTLFPASVAAVSQLQLVNPMPALPQTHHANMTLNPNLNTDSSFIDVGTAWRQMGPEFKLNRSHLTQSQQYLIVQFIDVNKDWPISKDNASSKEQQIQQCLSFTKYRNPVFLATLMTGSFYPTEEGAPGWSTTVGDVWVFVNMLLGSAVRLLGHQDKLVFPRPPKGTGVYSGDYLSRRGQASTPTSTGLTSREEIVYQLIMEQVEEADSELFDELTSRQLQNIQVILEHIVNKNASVIHLSNLVFNSIINLLGVDDESAINCLQVSCEIVLVSIKDKLQAANTSSSSSSAAVAQSSQIGMFSNSSNQSAPVLAGQINQNGL